MLRLAVTAVRNFVIERPGNWILTRAWNNKHVPILLERSAN